MALSIYLLNSVCKRDHSQEESTWAKIGAVVFDIAVVVGSVAVTVLIMTHQINTDFYPTGCIASGVGATFVISDMIFLIICYFKKDESPEESKPTSPTLILPNNPDDLEKDKPMETSQKQNEEVPPSPLPVIETNKPADTSQKSNEEIDKIIQCIKVRQSVYKQLPNNNNKIACFDIVLEGEEIIASQFSEEGVIKAVQTIIQTFESKMGAACAFKFKIIAPNTTPMEQRRKFCILLKNVFINCKKIYEIEGKIEKESPCPCNAFNSVYDRAPILICNNNGRTRLVSIFGAINESMSERAVAETTKFVTKLAALKIHPNDNCPFTKLEWATS